MSGFHKDGEFMYDLDYTGEQELIQVCVGTAPKDQEFVFFDVGANRGDWSDYMIRTLGNRPYSGHLFEISPVMRQRLRDNLRPTHEKALLVYNDFGLSDSNGSHKFRRYPQAEGVNSLVIDTDFWDWQLESEVEETLVMRGDEYCAGQSIEHINLLKIDTEGWEWPILHGFGDMFANHQIDVVQFEYGYLTADMHVAMKDFWRFFETHGYIVGPLSKEGVQFRNFTYWDNSFRPDANYVARYLP